MLASGLTAYQLLARNPDHIPPAVIILGGVAAALSVLPMVFYSYLTGAGILFLRQHRAEHQ